MEIFSRIFPLPEQSVAEPGLWFSGGSRLFLKKNYEWKKKLNKKGLKY
jgi:hypothetical protein